MKKFLSIVMTVVLILSFSIGVFADELYLASDSLGVLNGINIDLGYVKSGTVKTDTVSLNIERNGDYTKTSQKDKVYTDSGTVSIAAYPATNSNLTADNCSITLPADWRGKNNGDHSSETTSVITLTAPSGTGPNAVADGQKNFDINYIASGTNYIATTYNSSIAIHVKYYVDNTPPTLTAPDITAEATSATGANVTLTATATDAHLDSVTYSIGSGTTTTTITSPHWFPMGSTTVTCTATDLAGNTTTKGFNVIVSDNTAPTFSTILNNMIIPATSAAGAVVTIPTVTATDAVDGTVAVTFTKVDGTALPTTFPIGETIVKYSAIDNAENSASNTFTVTVTPDTVGPVLSGVPGNRTVDATSADGALVTFTASAFDVFDNVAVGVTFTISSGSTTTTITSPYTFPVGITTVTCTATDATGISTRRSFTVTVNEYVPVDTANPTVTVSGPTGWVNIASDDNQAFTWIGSDDNTLPANLAYLYKLNDANAPVTSDIFTLDTSASIAKSDFLQGDNTLYVWAKDEAGKVSSVAGTYDFKVDTITPTISCTLTQSVPNGLGLNGWYIKNVNVTFAFSDEGGSGIDSAPDNYTVSAEGINASQDFTVKDLAGNEASTTVPEIKLDKTAPTITGSIDKTANTHGWYNSDVTVSFAASDSVSGVASSTNSVTLTEGANQSVTGIATDYAGNSASAIVSGINIDETAPTITVEDNGVYLLDQKVAWYATDQSQLSGLATLANGFVDTSSIGVNKPQTITAIDKAGNSVSITIHYTVFSCSVILQPINSDGTSVFKLGNTIPVKFTINTGSGTYLDGQTFKISVSKINTVSNIIINETAVTSSTANTDNQFRYDSTSGQYIFNFSTRTNIFTTCISGGKYQINVYLGDKATSGNVIATAIVGVK